jgi:hypothetical protein
MPAEVLFRGAFRWRQRRIFCVVPKGIFDAPAALLCIRFSVQVESSL